MRHPDTRACLSKRAVAAARLSLVAYLLWLCCNVQAAASNPCGELHDGHYGPYDYRTQKAPLRIVESSHFGPSIEALIGSEWNLAGNLNYTLKSAPNHHRALHALVRFGEKFRSTQTEHLEFSIECYFDRAIRFRPDDRIVRSLYARYLGKLGRKQAAIEQLQAATILAEDDGFSHYNIGLVYAELGEYDRAAEQARRAQALGFERPELIEQLKRANRWPAADPAAPASAASR